MTPTDTELEQLAKAATPGPWKVIKPPKGRYLVVNPNGEAELGTWEVADGIYWGGNAAFIAAFNPAVALDLLTRLRAAETKAKELNHLLTDERYMHAAAINMLGPNGLKVVENWKARSTTRVHFYWGPDAFKMTGEERAQFILDMDARLAEKGALTPLDFNDSNHKKAPSHE